MLHDNEKMKDRVKVGTIMDVLHRLVYEMEKLDSAIGDKMRNDLRWHLADRSDCLRVRRLAIKV